jgi:tetratricopeptide (TPR) repeat protein
VLQVTGRSLPLRHVPFLMCLLALVPSARAEDWVRVRSAHFEVLSDAAPERARGVAVGLERFRRVMAAVLGRAPGSADPPIVVVAFRGRDSFAPFRPVYRGRPQDVEGYFQAGSDRDYIAASLGTDRREASETLFHEYAHVVLNRTLSAQPLWLSEGLAEVFSRWTAAEAEALVGLPAPDHLRRLQREKPMPLARLLQVDGSSPLYNEGDERGIFYAQSWALAHWIVFGRGANAPADLQAFLSAITAGAEPARAFASAFGANPDAAEALLAAYLAAPLPVGRFDTSGLDADVTVESEAPRRAEVELRLGDLLLHAERLPEARRHLDRAVESDPRFGPAHAALAHAALRQGRWEEARREVALALAADPADAVALSRYAELLVRETSARGEVLSPEREAEAVAALERALTLDPQLADACELLARLRPRPYDVRIAQVLVALARDPARADLGLTLAALYARKNDFTAARAALLRTGAMARDDVDRFLSQHLLSRLDGMTAGTAEVKGTLLALDCRPGGVLRFVVAGARAPLRLEAASATGVFLYGRDGSQLERTFTCGPQHEAVTARYRPVPVPSPSPEGADGTLMSLTFESR